MSFLRCCSTACEGPEFRHDGCNFRMQGQAELSLEFPSGTAGSGCKEKEQGTSLKGPKADIEIAQAMLEKMDMKACQLDKSIGEKLGATEYAENEAEVGAVTGSPSCFRSLSPRDLEAAAETGEPSNGEVTTEGPPVDDCSVTFKFPSLKDAAARGRVLVSIASSDGHHPSFETRGCMSSRATAASTATPATVMEAASAGDLAEHTIADKVKQLRSAARQSRVYRPNNHSAQGRNGEEPIRLSAEMIELVMFSGAEELLRGVKLSRILQRNGAVFASATGSAASYALSEQVSRLDAFVSHNWIMAGWKKFCALAWHFNFNFAVAVVLVVAVIISVLGGLGFMPHMDSTTYPPAKYGILARLILIPLLIVLMLFGRSLLSRVGFSGPMLFVDKVCIHQADRQTWRKGIDKLGAFISKSDKMVVLYSDVYLKKLWTVYEVASFLALHSAQDMVIVSVHQSMVFLLICIVIYVCQLLIAALHWIGFEYGHFVCYVAMTFSYMFISRHWSRGRAGIATRLKHFNIMDCHCSDSADGPIVYKSIASLMKAARAVPETATEEVGLAYFNCLIRTELPTAFHFALGRFNFKYKHYCVLGGCIAVPVIVDFFAGVPYGTSHALKLGQPFLISWWAITGWPLLAMYGEWLASLFLRWKGCRELLWLVFSLFVLAVPAAFLADRGMNTLVRNHSTTNFAVLFLLWFVGPFFTYFVCSGYYCPYLQRLCCCRQGDAEAGEESPVPARFRFSLAGSGALTKTLEKRKRSNIVGATESPLQNWQARQHAARK